MNPTRPSVVRPAAPPAVAYRPRPVGMASTVAGGAVPARPGLVPAVSRPGWPAPTSTAVAVVTATAPERIPARQFTAGNVISENIFGGPVTVGDPETTTVTISPYSDKVEAMRPALPEDEGWTDIFGHGHGAELPEGARMNRKFGRGTFGVPTPLGAVALGEPIRLANVAQLAKSVVGGGEMRSGENKDAAGGMSTMTKVLIAVGAIGVVGGGVWFLKHKKKA